MNFDFTESGSIKITMAGFIEDLIKTCKVNGLADSPAANYLFKVRPDCPKIDDLKREDFHSAVARCLYLGKRIRPDILVAVSFLSSRVRSPDMDDDKKLVRLLNYINATKHLGLKLTFDPRARLEAYIDASYAIYNDARSQTGLFITLGTGAINAKSTRQKLNTKSSTESELVGLSDMGSNVLWHLQFMQAQVMDPPAAVIRQDNMSTISMIKKGSSGSERTKHVAIRYYWLKDKIKSGDLEIIYCPTNSMIADILTKPLQGADFIKLRDLMLNWKY
jgi:hypothetical protein